MSAVTERPYGSWPSPLSPRLMVSGALRLELPRTDGGDCYWLEGRPEAAGRVVLVRRASDGTIADVTPEAFSVRSRVHEYGGGAYCVSREQVWFSNDADGRVYRLDAGAANATGPKALTAERSDARYADFVHDERHARVAAVMEVAREGAEPDNRLVWIGNADGAIETIASGDDFYAAPALSPDGTQLCWLSWSHPNMPWDGTRLWLARIGASGTVEEPRCVAGSDRESVFQPSFSPDGILTFVSDRDGFWNLYRLEGGAARLAVGERAEMGLPMWKFGMRTYAYLDEKRLALGVCRDGFWSLEEVSIGASREAREKLPVSVSALDGLCASAGQLLVIASSGREPASVVLLECDTGKSQVLRRSSSVDIDTRYLAMPEPVTFPTSEGQSAHGFYYAPANPDGRAALTERPPLIVMCHGGPTGSSAPSLSMAVQFWTTRGFAVLDVNYRGSTGYGRAYRNLLRGQWGVADVADCVNGARYLAAAGLVDEARLAIRGGSAGGFTVLAALTRFEAFKAGASYYGISDLTALARDTHKFESRYLDSLIGPYPEAEAVYRERSPINHVDRLSCPVIFFQGEDDRVVPANQAEMMANALREKGLPVAYLLFPGEQHGFRKASTIVRTLEAELSFYGQVFGFEPAGVEEPVVIENL